MNSDFTNLPYMAALIILIWILILLQRRQPRIAIGSWLIGLSFILASLIAGHLAAVYGNWYILPHTFRLCSDLIAGIIFMLYTGRPLKFSHSSLLLLLSVLPFIAVELLYGTDTFAPRPYVVSAIAGIIICVVISLYLKSRWWIPFAQSVAWITIAAFAVHGNARAAAYWALGAVYTAAAIRLWQRLRQATLGRFTVVTSLLLWALSFFIHPWVLFMPRIYAPLEIVWTMQKFFLVIGMLIVLFEDKVRESEYLAHHDELTGLPNRRLMEQKLRDAIQRGPTSVVLIDLNGFKAVNDSFGHSAGDHLLQIVARKLASLLEPGALLARLGGDEFVIVSPHATQALVPSIQEIIRLPIHLNEHATAHVDASIGIASFPEDILAPAGPPPQPTPEIASNLLRLADHRMYLDKQSR